MWTRIAVVSLAGALGAAFANRGIAVFHDGLRPIMPERMEGRMPRRDFASLAFGMSFGLVLGFGIPFSIAFAVLLNHALWLGTDSIGTWFPGPFEDAGSQGSNWLGLIGAAMAGALYGGFLCLGLEGLGWLFEHLPVKMSDSFQYLGGTIVLTFAAFPAVAVAYQHGIRSGILAFAITVVGRQAASTLGSEQPDLWALAVGMAVLAFCAIRAARMEGVDAALPAPPVERMHRTRRHLPAIAALGAVYAVACHLAIMAEGPQSIAALAVGDRAAAAGFSFVRALSFTPLKTMSALATGVFAIDGLGFVAPFGLAAPNVITAALGGAIVMSVEALSLRAIGNLVSRHPSILQAADNIRTGMTKVLELASLVGGGLAANSLAPGLGLLTVVGFYLLNEAAGTPVVRVAVGPVALILVGITANLLALLQVVSPV